MNVGDNLLLQLFHFASPLQLIQLYAVNGRFRAIIEHLFRTRSTLCVPISPDTPLLLHQGWQYLAPHSLEEVPTLPDAARTILYKVETPSSIKVLYPYTVVVYYQSAGFRGSTRPRRVLYQGGKLVSAHLPGSRSGHAAQQQIKIVQSLELEKEAAARINSQLILQSWDKKRLFLFSPSSSSSVLYQARIPSVPNPEDWIQALCLEFVRRGISGSCLFLCNHTPIACRLLLPCSDATAILPLKTVIHQITDQSPTSLFSSSRSHHRRRGCHSLSSSFHRSTSIPLL